MRRLRAELSGRGLCAAAAHAWGERGNVFDIRSAHTAGEAATAGYD